MRPESVIIENTLASYILSGQIAQADVAPLRNKLIGYRNEEYKNAIEKANQIPRSPRSRENAIVFYSNCNNPAALGDFAQCGSLAYEVEKKSGIPVILTSHFHDVHRFDLLYRSPSTQNRQLYRTPVQIEAVRTFDTNRIRIVGYVEVAYCKPNDHEYIEKVMMRDGGFAAIVGTANYSDDFHKNIASFFRNYDFAQNVKSFLPGFGESRSGITFFSYNDFKENIHPSDLVIPHISEDFLTEYDGKYGFIYSAKTDDPDQDVSHIFGYLSYFLSQSDCGQVVAIVNERDLLKKAATKLSETFPVSVFFVISGKKERICDNPAPQKALCITILSKVPSLHMRKLLSHANQFVALTGTSSTIEGLGEGKLVYYQNFSSNQPFVDSFLKTLLDAAGKDYHLYEFAKLLFEVKNGQYPKQLTKYLEDSEKKDSLVKLTREMVAKESSRLTKGLLEWLRLPTAAQKQALNLGVARSGNSNAANAAALFQKNTARTGTTENNVVRSETGALEESCKAENQRQ